MYNNSEGTRRRRREATYMTRSGRRNIMLICLAFLLCGAIHIIFYGVEFTDCIVQIFCGAVTVIWSVYVRRIITDTRLRRLFLAIVFFNLLMMLSQSVNYIFSQNMAFIHRWSWYAYYIPTMGIAAALLCISGCIYRDPQKKLGASYKAACIAGALLIAAVLTNDMHFLVFRFPQGPELFRKYSYGPLFFLYVICFILILMAAVFQILKKQKAARLNTGWLLASVPLAVMLLILGLNMFRLQLKINGIPVWQVGETVCFGMISFLEILITSGQIPANTDYQRIFKAADLPAVILDDQGTVKYRSSDTEYPFPKNGSLQVMSHTISGGKIEWAVDIAQINALNTQLRETTQQISARNEYLSSEAKVKQEKSELETRNRIYDSITRIVRPQLDAITAMLEDDEKPFDESLRSIAVLAAYIKRRSNMELLAESGVLSFEELSLAVSESFQYLRLNGVRAAVSSRGSGLYPSALVIAAYAQLESVIEDCLDTLTDILVSMKAEAGSIEIRIMIKADSITITGGKSEDAAGHFSKTVTVTKDGEDIIFVCSFAKGGEAS